MAWFDPIEWAPPLGLAGSRPYLLFTDAQQLSILWFGGDDRALCRQDFLVDPIDGSITQVGETLVDHSANAFDQEIWSAQISESGHIMLQTEMGTSG